MNKGPRYGKTRCAMLNAAKKMETFRETKLPNPPVNADVEISDPALNLTSSSHAVEISVLTHHHFQPLRRLGRLGVLLTVILGRVHHVGNGGLSFSPLARLETAIRVDPELIWLEVLKHLLNSVLDFLLAWYTR